MQLYILLRQCRLFESATRASSGNRHTPTFTILRKSQDRRCSTLLLDRLRHEPSAFTELLEYSVWLPGRDSATRSSEAGGTSEIIPRAHT